MARTKIPWADRTWNPVTGCTPCSPACEHCYAKRMANRLRGRFGYPQDKPFSVTFHEDRLQEITRRQKPACIFAGSMTDFYHPGVWAKWRRQIWDAMWACGQHRFMVLTKRPERMVKCVLQEASRRQFGWTHTTRPPWRPGDDAALEDIYYRDQCGWVGEGSTSESGWDCEHPDSDGECNIECPIFCQADTDSDGRELDDDGMPIDHEWMECYARVRDGAAANVALGFSAWDQASLERGSRALRRLRWELGPWAMLFVSLEPLLSPVTFRMEYYGDQYREPGDEPHWWSPLDLYTFEGLPRVDVPILNQVILGCESGPNRRPFQAEWARDIRDQCIVAGVPFFYKQGHDSNGKVEHIPLLDGRTWTERPEWFFNPEVKGNA